MRLLGRSGTGRYHPDVPRPTPGSATRTLLARLRHARVLLLLTTLVGALLALLITQWWGPAFEATSRVQVAPALALNVAPFDQPDATALVAAEFEALRSDAVADAAQDLLPDLAGDVAFSVDPDANILTVVARADDRATARVTAETYVAAYTDLRQDRLLVELDQAERVVTDQLETTRGRIDEADPGELNALEASQRELTAALTDIALARSLGATASTTAFGETTVTDQRGLSVPVTVALGALLGLASGVLLALASQRLTPTFVTAEDVDRDELPAPLLAVIPPAGQPVDLQGPAGDPYRALRSELVGPAPSGSTMLFMTPDGGAAAARVVAGLAETCSGFGEGVVVAELDLREPSVHRMLDAAPLPGLTSILAGDAALLDAAQRVDVEGQVWFLAAGERPERPAEVLAAPETHQLIAQISEGADWVLLHGPPITVATDAAEIRSMVSAAVLVIEAGSTRRKATRDAAERIERLGMRLAGLVLVGATGSEVLRPPDRTEADLPALGAPSPGTAPLRASGTAPHTVDTERLMSIDLVPVHPVPSGPAPDPVIALTDEPSSPPSDPADTDQEGRTADDRDSGVQRKGTEGARPERNADQRGPSGGAGNQRTPVHHQGVAGDPAGEVGSEEERGSGDVGGFSQPA
jgi:Mrp family chromosome partitioning ATPase